MESLGCHISKRSVYGLGGLACGTTLGLLLYCACRPCELFLAFPPFVGMVSALWYAEITNKIPSADEANAPITLFPKDKKDP